MTCTDCWLKISKFSMNYNCILHPVIILRIKHMKLLLDTTRMSLNYLNDYNCISL